MTAAPARIPAPLDILDPALAGRIAALAPRLEGYANLLVRRCVAVAQGQELVVTAPVEAAYFARMVVRAGYDAGAGHVTVIWGDDDVARLEYERTPLAYFEHMPAWKRAQLNDLAEQGACFLWLEGEDPDVLAGIDPRKPAAARKARNTEATAWRDGMDFGRNRWGIAGVPTAAWARKVFPDEGTVSAIARLWDAILATARADNDDPLEAWRAHDEAFARSLAFMNGHHFDRLHYVSANGTDLTVGLTDRQVWAGGSGASTDGVRFFPNIPTEEVFTSPDRMRVNGIVHAALPLVHDGVVIRDFWFRFSDGAVVEHGAATGGEVLDHILATDENARRLGECALVSKNTPIRQSGLLFYSTLYDENASCHLALGTGFPECYEGGLAMGAYELLAHGVNHGATHVDFMIGADDLRVDGVAVDGTVTPVFVDGQWAWE